MDWTGGTRRRFASGKSNAVLQKQKAHFAKLRAASQHPQSSHHSFKPNYLQDKRRSTKGSLSRESTSGHRGYERLEYQTAPLPVLGQRPIGQPRSERKEPGEHIRSLEATVKQQRLQRRSPSVVYVSSNSRSSSAGSPISDRHGERKQKLHQTRNPSMADEERFLRAKRQKLLARTDWLGLDVVKPIRIKFASSHDKDHIGKRRKIRSSVSHKGKPAKRKLSVVVPFARLFSPCDRLMSGALQPDEIQVKIGTDAFVSQTQQSRHSHTPGRTSMRHPSTEFGPLSEESMLLGPDEDAFEPAVFPQMFPTIVDPNMHNAYSIAAVAGSQITQNLQYVPERPEMRSFRAEQEQSVQQGTVQRAPSDDFGTKSNELIPESDYAIGVETVPRTHAAARETAWPIEDLLGPDHVTMEANQNRMDLPPTDRQPMQPIDEESPWRHMVGIGHSRSSHHSIAALRSSSMHDITSDTSGHRPVLDQVSEPTCHSQTYKAPLEDNSVGSMLANGLASAGLEPSVGQSDDFHSLSASLKLIKKLADHPAAPARQAEEDANDEALWRQFVVGSEDSSDEVSQQPDYSASQDAEETLPPARASSAFSVSGLGTSVQSTLGDTLIATGEPSNATPDALSKRQSDSTFQKGPRSCAMLTSKQAGEVADLDEDRIEDDQPPIDGSRKASNIQSATTSILNPKRFKPPKKVQALDRKPSRFRLSRRSRPAARAGHSVYDLVDSDGMSMD